MAKVSIPDDLILPEPRDEKEASAFRVLGDQNRNVAQAFEELVVVSKLSSSSVSAGANSGDITIQDNKRYLVLFTITDITGNGSVYLRINSLSASNYVDNGTASQDTITITTSEAVEDRTGSATFSGHFYLCTCSTREAVWGTAIYKGATAWRRDDFWGFYDASITPTSFEIYTDATDYTGSIDLYEVTE